MLDFAMKVPFFRVLNGSIFDSILLLVKSYSDRRLFKITSFSPSVGPVRFWYS